VMMAMVERALGIKTNPISYDKPAERYASLIGGHVDVLFEQPGDVRSFLEAKQMKPALTFLRERPAAFADVPSLKDVGVDAEPLLRFRGFFVKKGTPDDRAKFLEQAVAQAIAHDPEEALEGDAAPDHLDPRIGHETALGRARAKRAAAAPLLR